MTPPDLIPPDRSALMHNYAEPAVTFVRGEGSVLYDLAGKPYLDFLSGLAVTSLGHAHPEVADAIAAQARTLSHVSNLFGNTVGPEVAVTLDRLVGGGTERAGGQVFFGNSGAEANECALKLARRWAGPGRFAVVSTWDAFHGRTLATLSATGQPEKQQPFVPLPEGFDHVPFDDLDAMDDAVRPDPGGGRPGRADPRRGRGGGALVRLPGRAAPAVHRPWHPADGRRDPDRPGADRALVRLPAPRGGARRRDHGQGSRQRDAGRGVLGPGRGGRGLRARRPREHVRRPAAGHVGGPGHPGGHGGRGRPRPGPASPGPGSGPGWRPSPVWRRCGARACCWPRSSPAGSPSRRAGRRSTTGLVVNAPETRRPAVRPVPPRLRRGDRPGGGHPRAGAGPVGRVGPRSRARTGGPDGR